MSVLMEAMRLRQPLPTWWPAGAAPHPAARHLQEAEAALRCVRSAYADNDCMKAAVFVRLAIEDLRSALAKLEAKQ